MKDIKQYFVDTAKPNDRTRTNNVEKIGQEVAVSNTLRMKRNRVKIRISRRSSDERVCNIIDNSSDMIDKTPSPFTKINKGEDLSNGDTPKGTVKKLVQPTRRKTRKQMPTDELEILAEVNLNSASSDHGEGEHRKEKVDSEMASFNKDAKSKKNKKHEVKSLDSNKARNDDSNAFANQANDEVIDVHNTEVINGKRRVSIIDLTDCHGEDEVERSEESNAFQILMNRNKEDQIQTSIIPGAQDVQLDLKKTGQNKEKLKESKEKLIALADKKGYSKRKEAEIEESSRIEKVIEDRVKFLTGDGRKSNPPIASLNHVSQRHSSSSLLNYFSKTSLGIPEGNTFDATTFKVKADVHISADADGEYSNNILTDDAASTDRKLSKTSVEVYKWNGRIEKQSPSDTLKDGEDVTDKKHRWSLRIKLQGNDGPNLTPDESSDEEIFSPKSKRKQSTRRNKTMTSHMRDAQNNIKQLNSNRTRKSESENETISLLGFEQQNVLIENSTKRKVPCTVLENCKSTSEIKNRTNISASNNNLKRKSAEKLAPLFTKRLKPDPAVLAARKLFLQPDMPDTENRSKKKKTGLPGVLPFPKIGHVTQLSTENSRSSIDNALTLPIKNCNFKLPPLDVRNYKDIMNLNAPQLKTQKIAKKLNEQSVDAVISEIKERCCDVTDMWNTISRIVKGSGIKKTSPKTKQKKGKSVDKTEPITQERDDENQDQYSMWIHKYKPRNAHGVVGNEAAAKKLKDWLDNWKSTEPENCDSSGDEFYSSDCSRSSNNENKQVTILMGPHGSGKSASVYAVAEELGYTVLEVNASSRRTGKKLLKEFEEATKSHRIKKENHAALFKPVLNDDDDAKKIPQNSLILLEDVDIIFEEDEGFISATYQLVSKTKRPIVMTCRNVCPHLNKMAPQQNRIYFQNPTGTRVAALLELISIAETGYRLPNRLITGLLQAGDLRKALLQLQYLLLSGPPQVLDQDVNIRNSLWHDMHSCVYKPAIKKAKKKRMKKIAKSDKTENMNEILRTVSRQLDSMSLASSLANITDLDVHTTVENTQPSLSLAENHLAYSASHTLSMDIAEWLVNQAMCQDYLNEDDSIQYRNNMQLKRQLNEGIDETLSHATSLVLDRRTISTDYLPSIRMICRAEEYRSQRNSKRGNRFFHYLHGTKIPLASLRPNILTAACKIMQDKRTEAVSDNTSQSGNI